MDTAQADGKIETRQCRPLYLQRMLAGSGAIAEVYDFSIGSGQGQAGNVYEPTDADGGGGNLYDIIRWDGHPLGFEPCAGYLQRAEAFSPSPYAPRGDDPWRLGAFLFWKG
jgi:hypothetical protein